MPDVGGARVVPAADGKQEKSNMYRSLFSQDSLEEEQAGEGLADRMQDEEDRLDYISRLRPFRGNADACSTWLDQDDSGNFDPDAGHDAASKQRTRQIGNASTVLNHSDKLTRQRETWKEILKHCRADHHKTCYGVVKLKVRTPAANPNLQIADHWPKEACLSRVVQEGHQYNSHDISLSNTITADRRFGVKTNDTAKEKPSLIGHPSWHGCWACFELGERCSIESGDPDRSYPCKYCKTTKDDCELVRPPQRKRTCFACKRKKGNRCSYVNDSTAEGPCQSCQQDGLPCFAPPAKDGLHRRIVLDELCGPDGKPKTSGKEQSDANSNSKQKKKATGSRGRTCDECREKGQECGMFSYDETGKLRCYGCGTIGL